MHDFFQRSILFILTGAVMACDQVPHDTTFNEANASQVPVLLPPANRKPLPDIGLCGDSEPTVFACSLSETLRVSICLVEGEESGVFFQLRELSRDNNGAISIQRTPEEAALTELQYGSGEFEVSRELQILFPGHLAEDYQTSIFYSQFDLEAKDLDQSSHLRSGFRDKGAGGWVVAEDECLAESVSPISLELLQSVGAVPVERLRDRREY